MIQVRNATGSAPNIIGILSKYPNYPISITHETYTVPVACVPCVRNHTQSHTSQTHLHIHTNTSHQGNPPPGFFHRSVLFWFLVISFDLSSTSTTLDRCSRRVPAPTRLKPITLDRCSMSIFDLGAQKLIDGSELDMKSIAGKPALAMNVASR